MSSTMRYMSISSRDTASAYSISHPEDLNPQSISYDDTKRQRAVTFDRSLLTRNLCIAGLAVTWMVAAFCIGFGAYVSRVEYEPEITWDYTRDLLVLIQTLVITFCQDSLGYIHTVSLRWDLQRSGQLNFNSNLRLWQNTRYNGPNAWYSNMIVLIGMVATFGASPLSIQDTTDSGYTNFKFLGEAWIILGVGLSMQAGITTWALSYHNTWPTWSSNPIDVAAACISRQPHALIPREGRALQGLSEVSEPTMAHFPAGKQPSAYNSHQEVKKLTWFVWGIFVVFCLWSLSVMVASAIRYDGVFQSTQFWNPLGNSAWLNIELLNSKLYQDPSFDTIIPQDFVWIFALICGIQSVITLFTHTTELHVNLSRDESVWRKASDRGHQRKGNALKVAFTSHQSITLLVMKVLLNWFYGLTFSVTSHEGFGFSGAPTVYMTTVALILAVYATTLVCTKPKGAQPAAFGQLQVLVDLVDEWPEPHNSLYWGDKGDYCPVNASQAWAGVRHAGTSCSRLQPVNAKVQYA